MRRSALKRHWSRLFKNWSELHWWKRVGVPCALGTIYYNMLKGNKGIHVMEEDWDNLIVLDACRYDAFKLVTGVDADFRISRGSDTGEFLEENFRGRKYLDTVVVSANPQLDIHIKDSVYELISVWRDCWDERFNTVLPADVVRRALETSEGYPDKRLIAWFLQPHDPFIAGQTPDPEGLRGLREATLAGRDRPSGRETRKLWRDVDQRKTDLAETWAAYRANVEAVVPHAFELARKLPGKSVITADHGEAFRWLWFPIVKVIGHPARIHIEELVKVPWLAFDNGARKAIRAEAETAAVRRGMERLRRAVGLGIAAPRMGGAESGRESDGTAFTWDRREDVGKLTELLPP